MQNQNWLTWGVGALVIWVNSLDYVFLGNLTQLIACVYLAAGVIIKAEERIRGRRYLNRVEYKRYLAWKEEHKE